MSSRNTPIYLFRPMDTTLSPCIVGSTHKDTTKNVLAIVDVLEWEPKKLTRASLVEILGPCGDYESEQKALLMQYSKLPWKKFKKELINPPNKDNRIKISGYTLNIDPIGCRDIDDTITFGDDGYVYITIADVSAWMAANPHHPFVDISASMGQTLYASGKAVSPLLPIEQECSLLPNEERLGVSLKFKWTGTGITDVSFLRTILVNTQSFTYESIYNSDRAQTIREISAYLSGHDSIDSHEWIEQFMLFYNCEAAKILVEKNRGFLRIHDAPNEDRLKLIESTLGHDTRFLAYKSAQYASVTDSKDKHHWGLDKKYYCHASSPIRRFADIVNQSILSGQDTHEWVIKSDSLNDLAKKAKRYDRDAFFLEQVMATESRCTNGTVLNDHRVWAPEWNRMVTCKNTASAGTKGVLRYSLDMNQPTWKRRMVFKFEDTNCLE